MKNASLFLLLITTFGVKAQNYTLSSNCETNPPNFGCLSYENANKAVKSEEEAILETRTKIICPEYITNLVYQLCHEKLSDDNKTLAIYFLGIFHPVDANSIEILIENIDFRAARLDPTWSPRRWGEYPAEEALVKIGQPVVIPVLNHLPTETNELRRHLMCEVLKQVEGKKGFVFNEAEGRQIAQNQIKQKLADESNLTRKANLELTLKELEK